MKTLALSALVCALMALTRAAAIAEATPKKDQTETHLVKRSLCPYGWTAFSNRCFYYNPRPMTWAKAEKNCESMGGNLASVHNFLEYRQIQRLIMSASHDNKEAWIGGSDAQEETQWFWTDGTPFNYLKWCAGEPNNHSGRQNCLHMNHGAHKCWDDYQCYHRSPSVCAQTM